jgi:predicted DNA-binding transcriptional regulator AlpA
MTEAKAPERYFTLPQVAERVKLHRTTLLRMEQRGVIPKAKWATKPFRARVYTEADIVALQRALDEYFASHMPNEAGMIIDPDSIEAGE